MCFALSRNKQSDLLLAAPKRGSGSVPLGPSSAGVAHVAPGRSGSGGAAAVQQRARTTGHPLRSRSPDLAAPRSVPSRISVRGAPSRRSRPAGLGQRARPGAGGDAPGRLRAATPGAAFPGAGRWGEPGRAALRRRHRDLPARRERLTNLGGRSSAPNRGGAGGASALRRGAGIRLGGCAAAHVAIIFSRRSAGLSALLFAPAAAARTSWGPTAAGGPRPRRARGEAAALRRSSPGPVRGGRSARPRAAPGHLPPPEARGCSAAGPAARPRRHCGGGGGVRPSARRSASRPGPLLSRAPLPPPGPGPGWSLLRAGGSARRGESRARPRSAPRPPRSAHPAALREAPSAAFGQQPLLIAPALLEGFGVTRRFWWDQIKPVTHDIICSVKHSCSVSL